MAAEYDSIVREMKADQLRTSLYVGGRQAPDAEAKVQALADRVGLPIEAVRRNQAEVEMTDRMRSFDYEKTVKENPKLAAWLADQNNMAVAHDDFESLSGLEQTLVRGRDLGGSLVKGVVGQGAGTTLSGAGELYGAASRSLGRVLQSVLPDGAMSSIPVLPWWLDPQQILDRPGETLKAFGNQLGPPPERQNLATDVVEGVGQLGFQIASYILTGGASSMTMLLSQGADIMADKTATDGADSWARDTAIVGGGAITALTERYGLDKILNRLPPAIRNRTLRFLADKLAAGGIEAAQEFTEGLLHDITRKVLTNSDTQILQGVDREMTAAGLSAALVRTLLGVRGHHQAKQTEDFIVSLGDTAKASKLRERLPDRFKTLVEHYTKDGPVENVMIPAERFTEYAQTAGIDPEVMAKQFGATNYTEAAAAGSDVVIPMKDFVTNVAASDHLQGLLQDIRLAPEEMTSREAGEAEKAQAETEKQIKAEIEKINEASKASDELDSAIQEVVTNVEGQLATRYDAKTAKNMATVMRGVAVLAQRANPDANPLEAAQQLWGKYGLTIDAMAGVYADDGTTGTVMDQGGQQQFVVGDDGQQATVNMVETPQGYGWQVTMPDGSSLGTFDDVQTAARAAQREVGGGVMFAQGPRPKLSEAQEKTRAILTPVTRFLMKEEGEKMRAAQAQQLVDQFNQLPAGEEFAAVAFAGKAKRKWYERSARAIANIFGADAPRFAALLAATSPQTSVENNLLNALNIWKNWVAAGRPTERAAIVSIMGASVQGNKGEDSVLDAWINNSVRALTSEDVEKIVISGPKVNSFMLNLRGYVDEVTNDAWMANFALVDQMLFGGSLNVAGTDPGKGWGYLAMSARVRQAAQILTKRTGDKWSPAEVKETVWSWAKTLYEMADAAGETRSAVELLRDKALTDELINATPDFGTLFHTGVYDEILRSAGYGEQLDRLTELVAAEDAAQPGAEGQAAPFTEKAAAKYLNAAANRLDLLRRERRSNPQFEVTLEAIPSTNTEVGKWLVGQPFDVQVSFTDSVGAGFEQELVERLVKAKLTPKQAQGFATENRPGVGAYDGSIRANRVLEVSDQRVADLAAAFIAWGRDQDAVPWFRARPTLSLDLDTAQGVRFVFPTDLDQKGRETFYRTLQKALGPGAGFTQDESNSIVVINFGGDAASNEAFLDKLDRLATRLQKAGTIASAEHFGAESNYVTLPTDAEIQDLASGLTGQPDLQGWLSGWRDRIRQEGVDFARAHGAEIADAQRQEVRLAQNETADPLAPGKGSKGVIQIAPNRRMRIRLFETADLSTFLHETGHFYLEVLGDLAEAEGTSQQVKDDYAKILKWLKVKDRAGIKREHHEKWARANEAYLMEGKAPSAELRAVFQRFSAWLKLIYRQLTSLNVELTDEVRGVMDRIYASDAEITKAEAEANLQALFVDAKAAGMTEEEFALYRDAIAEQTVEAKDELQQKLMRVEKLKREAWWKAERKKMAEEVADEFDESPVAQAFERLTAKDSTDRLNRSQLVELYGADILKQLPRGYGEGSTTPYIEGGEDVDAVAETLGYASGDDLVQALIAMPNRARFIAEQSEGRMMERHGDLLNSVALADAAMEAVHNEQREKVVRMELRALNRLIRDVKPFVDAEKGKAKQDQRAARAATDIPPVASFRDAARGLIGQKQVRDLNPFAFLVAERKASKAAFEAMAKKDYAEAQLQKQRELLNHYLYLEAVKAKAEAAKIVAYLKKFDATEQRAKLAKAGPDYLDQIDTLLERYSFRQVSQREVARHESLALWLDRQEAEGHMVAVPIEIQDEARRVNWQQVQIDELRALRDSVKNIAHLAFLKNKLIRKRKAIEFGMVVDELLAAVESSGLKPTGDMGRPNMKGEGVAARGAAVWRKFDAAHLKVEQLVSWLDGGRINGPWAKYLFDLADDAQTMEYDLHSAVTTKLQELSESMPKAWRHGLMDRTALRLRGFDKPITRYDLISIALNMGNAQNLQRLTDGYQWSELDFARIRETLTEQDWRFVQGTWDAIETLWPHMAALEERTSGLPPEKVQAQSFEAAGQEWRGGYFPLVYDARTSNVGEKQATESESVQNFMAQGYGRASTNRGASKARVEALKQKPLLDYEQVITSHLAKVIKDISHREAVIGIHKILTAPQIKEALIERIGQDQYQELRRWLQTLVNDRADTLHQASGLGQFVMKARTNMAIVTMGWKISTMMAQIAGLGPSLDVVKPQFFAKAMIRATRHPGETWALITGKSGEMRNRSNTIERDAKDALIRMRGEKGVAADVRRTAFYLTAMADRVVSVPTWLGAYDQALAEGLSEEDAVRAGDRAVRLSQGAGGSKDLSAVQRSNELMKLLTMYYTPFNVLYARLRDVGFQTNQQGARYLPKAAARVLALVILPAVLGELLAARGPDEDEDPVWWAIRKSLLYPLATIPVVRDFSSYLEAAIIEATGEGQVKYRPGYKLSPVATAIEKIAQIPGKVVGAASGDLEFGDAAWDIFESTGYVVGLPTAQVRITGEYLLDLLMGNADPENAAELLRDALYRRPRQ